MKPTDLPLYTNGDGLVARGIAFSLENRFVILLVALLLIAAGLYTAPFDWDLGGLPRDPVAVDAIPDLGENQQIVFTEWTGRSPQDIEDQITYPLTTRLLNIRGVRTVRSFSMFGFSSIYVVFEEGVDFYWSRDRVQEKLNAIPPEELPEGVRPRLGPDATPLGQVFWYTLEGRDAAGEPTGGWDLHELRAIQDWQVKFELLAVPGVAEVASVGGFVQEYQVEVDPDALRAQGVTLPQVVRALQESNIDTGARTMEINRVEYIVRGLGLVERIADLENAVVRVADNVPIRVRDVARVSLGPALRRGALDKDGAEAVGGVVVAQYGVNPMAVLQRVHARLAAIAPSLPARTVQVAGADGTARTVESRVTVAPFYDRSHLIEETLGTLEEALTLQVLVTVLVVVAMLMHLRSSILVSLTLPVAVLICFVAMRVFGITANVVALAGIAIAIGTIVDMGIVLTENILEHQEAAASEDSFLRIVYRASTEVGGAILTAVATTVIGFLPVFFLLGDQGKLYRPLAFTKTFALAASLVVALFLLPPLAHLLLGRRRATKGAAATPPAQRKRRALAWNLPVLAAVLIVLAGWWLPLGRARGLGWNLLLVGLVIGGLLLFFRLFRAGYERILRWCLARKAVFLLMPLALLVAGGAIWAGLGRELMPRLDEGAFLFMPSAMPHASIGEAREILRTQDKAIRSVPEVASAVGKLGRVDSPLDPAPVGMIETIIHYRPEYLEDERGRVRRFRYDPDAVALEADAAGAPVRAPDGKPYYTRGVHVRTETGALAPDPDGEPFRVWRRPLDPALNPDRAAWSGIRTPDDIWDEIVRVARVPGVTSASKLGPIETRIVMLQSGIKGRVGLRVAARGKLTLADLQEAGVVLEQALKRVPAIRPETVSVDRLTGKPYLELDIDRAAISRHGLNVVDVQRILQAAVGGTVATRTVEGRERYAVLVRYLRELRDSPEALGRVLVPTASGAHVPLRELLVDRTIRFRRGPSVIKGEDGGLVLYVTFDTRTGVAVVDAVEQAKAVLDGWRASGELTLPAGIQVEFAGAYQRYLRTMERLLVLVPLALVLIFFVLYLEFRRVATTVIVFSGVAVAWAGGFVLVWLYGQPWFLDLAVGGVSLREVFQVAPINMSTAVWVGFLALFGIATDDGVVMATYLEQSFRNREPAGPAAVREATVRAARRRVRPCLMTTATTLLALLPVLTSSGRGSEIMLPMAIPVFGGMLIEVVTMLVVPVLYCAVRERGGWLGRGAAPAA
ncbi:MAG: efflux RND transporter permease subunit [Planctomycetota bacterium]